MPLDILGLDPSLGVYAVPLLGALCWFVIVWPFSVWRRDASFVDFVWGPGFFGQVLIVTAIVPSVSERASLALGLIGVWSIRLGVVLIRRRIVERVEDPRYTAIRDSWGHGFWWKSLFIVFVLQAVLQWLVALGPIAIVAANDTPLGVVAVLGAVIAVGGLVLETIADHQLDRFKERHGHGGLLTTGLRAHVRHPNYTGEIVFWVGIAIVALDGGIWMGIVSPILIALFLLKVSGVPMLDERLSKTRPGYARYRDQVPALVPNFAAWRQRQNSQ